MISKGKRKYLTLVYVQLMRIKKFKEFNELFGQPIPTNEELRILSEKHNAIIRELYLGSARTMESIKSFMVAEVPVVRQRVVEIDKSTIRRRSTGLPFISIFAEKGPTYGPCF